MRHIHGVKGVVNSVEVVRAVSIPNIERHIRRALHRDAEIDARSIEVTVSGSEVTLSGTVGSWHERESAERAAVHATGITRIDNRIRIESPEGSPVGDGAEDELC